MIKIGDVAWCVHSKTIIESASIPYRIAIIGAYDSGYLAVYPGDPISNAYLQFLVPLSSVFAKESDAWKSSYEFLSKQMNNLLIELEEVERGIKGALLRESSM